MELVRFTSHRGFSARRIFLFAMTVLVTALLTTLSLSPPTYAADPQADWKGESILYDGRQYFPAADAKASDSHGLPVGTKYYVSTSDSDAQNGSTSVGSNANNATTKAFFIYFAPGTDPPTATSAQHTSYDVNQAGTYSNRQANTTITLTPQSQTNTFSACTVEGIGWIICPVTVFLAGGMDFIFGVIAQFVEVQPLTVNDPNGALHIAWNVMRSFANIAFIILFLIIIYSQITSWGISNYGLKRLLPRLVIAAILVNVSFYVTAIAVDLSNIAGYGLQQILVGIRESTFTITNETWTDETTSWANIAGAVLSGGAATYGIVALSTATAGSIASAVYFLIPLLVGLVLTAVFVMLILAARQAIIIILIVISPLAFVANLLPNTEKWFDKWRDLFMTMLIFFPAFSLVFGGSQLAGGLIIQNASGPFGLVMMIFGMAVQIAPLIITPLILKLSGSLLGRIAQIVNDPRKGMLDRTKNWANDRGNLHRNRSLQAKNGVNPMRRIAKRFDAKNRYIKDATSAYEKAVETNALERNQAKYADLHTITASADMRKERLENEFKTHTQREINMSGSRLHVENADLELSKAALGQAIKRTEVTMAQYQARHIPTGATPELAETIRQISDTHEATAVQEQRLKSAQVVRETNLANALNNSAALRTQAGGIDPQGATRAAAHATAVLQKIEKEALDNSVQLLNSEAISMGTTLKVRAAQIVEDELKVKGSHDRQVVNAAFEAVAQDGNISLLRKARIDANKTIEQQELTKLFARNAGTMKEKGGFDLQANPNLARVSAADMNVSIANTIGEVTGENIKSVKAGFWNDVSSNIGTIYANAQSSSNPGGREGLEKAYVTLTAALNHEDAAKELGDRLEATINMHKFLHSQYKDGTKEVDYENFEVTRGAPKRP